MRARNMALIITLEKNPSHDAIRLLKDDHRRVRRLLRRFENARGGRREKLRYLLEHELNTHTQIEEEIFYPAFRDAARRNRDRRLYFEAVQEHQTLDLVLPQVSASIDANELRAKATVLRNLVRQHIDREERKLFRRARNVLGRAERITLGRQMQQRREELDKQGQPQAKAA
jgi:hemerythrin-like domain-containing protein